DRNREFKVVRGRSERKRRRLRVVRSKFFPHIKRQQEHHNEVDQQRHGDSQDIQREPNDVSALEREHHHNREQQGDQRERADSGDEITLIPSAPFHTQKQGAG